MRDFIQEIELIRIFRVNFPFFCIFFIEFLLDGPVSWIISVVTISITTFIAVDWLWLAALALWATTGANRVPRNSPPSKIGRMLNLTVLFIIIGHIWLTMTWIERVSPAIINDILNYSFRCIFEEYSLQLLIFVYWSTYMFWVFFPQLLLLLVVFRW